MVNNKKTTPMERQYQEIKSRHRDKILLFRLGDFYEMFNEDAKIASSILNIALTKRHSTPMCGFPHHAANQYVHKLLDAGKKVAICDQIEDPALAKGIVKREVTDIITPGTIVDESFISNKENNYLCSLYNNRDGIALSFVDVSTGEFFISCANNDEKYRFLQDELARFAPSEIIYNDETAKDSTAMAEIEKTGALFQSFPKWYFEDKQQDEEFFAGVEIPDTVLENLSLNRCMLGIFNYLAETHFQSLANIKAVWLLDKKDYIELDDFSLRNLELVKNMQDGSKKFTLLDVMDKTITPMGGRLLRRWIVLPLYDLARIYQRQNFVEAFFDDSILTKKTRSVLQQVADVDRLTTRVALKKILPKGVVSLIASLKAVNLLKNFLSDKGVLADIADKLNTNLSKIQPIIELVDSAIMDEPLNSFGGSVIKNGYNSELDKLRTIMKDGKDWIIKLQNTERKRTGISSLKIKYNKVFGYFIEVSKTNLSNVPEEYIRKQSLVNAERFTIPQLSDYEVQIIGASDKIINLEEGLYNSVVAQISVFVPTLQNIATIVAEIDVYSNFGEIASNNRYIKPVIDNGDEFIVEDARHPVVEKYMGFNLFVPNDIILNNGDDRILLITGPNMAGKSTYLRQTALVAVMAQIGSYVPAKTAKIGMIDKIFTRIGASDQLSAGRSTFLVEMEEAANILKNTTHKSLIIMDELGRGTSTYDGLSIAWAVIEYLHEHPNKGGKTLFATHYHELTKLGEKNGIKNYNIAVREYNEELIFLRKVVEGPADQSYGIYVAKLAGINDEIIERAKIILENLEAEGERAKDIIERRFDKDFRDKPSLKTTSELQLFPDNTNANAIEKIKNLDINRITPVEAITFLSEIKKNIGK